MSAAGLADLFSLYSAFPLLASASFIADSPASSGSSTSLSLTTDSLSTEPALLLKAFSSIFSDNESSWEAAQTISRNAREEVGLPNTTSLGYGEILPESVFTIMCEIKDVFGLERGGVVYDLGSGSGRVLFAACLAHDFRLSKGIEFIESLHNAALRNKSRWEEHNVVTPEEGGPVDRVEFDFLKGDITKITSRALSPAPTVLFCHATLFDDGEAAPLSGHPIPLTLQFSRRPLTFHPHPFPYATQTFSIVCK